MDLISWWRAVFPTVVDADRALIVAALARFHYGIVSIHPFLDGNGRLARVLTNQAARDLLRRSVGPELVAVPDDYFASLRAANEGDLEPLEALIRLQSHELEPGPLVFF